MDALDICATWSQVVVFSKEMCKIAIYICILSGVESERVIVE